VALWRGWRPGVETGILCGLLQLLLDAHIYHPIQILLDYPIAFGLLGFSGIAIGTVPGILLGCFFRFIAHVTSGIVFFAAYAPEDTSVWAYSAAYNASYLIPDAILASLLVPLLLKRIGNKKPAAPKEAAGE
jgi:thiamine transporter